MPLSEGSAEPSMLLVRNRARPIHTDCPQWQNVNSAPFPEVLRHRSFLNDRRGGWVWLLAFAHTAGRVDLIQGPVAGEMRGLVRVGDKRTVRGSQISRLYTTRWARRSRNHSISVGGFAALRHILTIEPLAGESRVSKAVIGRFLPFQNGR